MAPQRNSPTLEIRMMIFLQVYEPFSIGADRSLGTPLADKTLAKLPVVTAYCEVKVHANDQIFIILLMQIKNLVIINSDLIRNS
jgi:hypothetical protein